MVQLTFEKFENAHIYRYVHVYVDILNELYRATIRVHLKTPYIITIVQLTFEKFEPV